MSRNSIYDSRALCFGCVQVSSRVESSFGAKSCVPEQGTDECVQWLRKVLSLGVTFSSVVQDLRWSRRFFSDLEEIPRAISARR